MDIGINNKRFRSLSLIFLLLIVGCSPEVKKDIKPITKLDCLDLKNAYTRVEVDLEGGNWRFLANSDYDNDEIGKIFSSDENYILFSHYHSDDDTWNTYYFLNRSTLDIYVTSSLNAEVDDLSKDEDQYNLIFQCELSVPKV